MKTKIIIMCAGKGTRWCKKTPKQIAEFKGIPNILQITQMLDSENISKDDIIVIVNEKTKKYFPKTLNLQIGSDKREIDRFRNAYPFMNNCGRMIFLYGDVLYHIDDLKIILDTNIDAFLGRFGENINTNKLCSELFAVVIKNFDKFKANVDDVAYKFETKQIKREIGWEVYNNKPDDYIFISLSLNTDDYDTCNEYKNLLKYL